MITTILFILLLIVVYVGGFVSGEMWKDFLSVMEEKENARKDD